MFNLEPELVECFDYFDDEGKWFMRSYFRKNKEDADMDEEPKLGTCIFESLEDAIPFALDLAKKESRTTVFIGRRGRDIEVYRKRVNKEDHKGIITAFYYIKASSKILVSKCPEYLAREIEGNIAFNKIFESSYFIASDDGKRYKRCDIFDAMADAVYEGFPYGDLNVIGYDGNRRRIPNY